MRPAKRNEAMVMDSRDEPLNVVPDDATEVVQWFVDNGVPLPPGYYHITRPIQLRGSAIAKLDEFRK